ncbi:MAG: YidC/Oxa1 family membrane protein insertase [Faecalibacterium sp.]|nr:YidC/Oxa1 family membrane protein insertase [Ruminococcus sp.]MCM1391479.1 YidC/Oxa1 family membrane protein insertase [Ruminococcus sp.]MCM1485263.1 YidC/Oxa1 family membrane protein insertase [Faecalibacterium sp.]
MQSILAFFYSIFGYLFRILYGFIGNYGLALLIFTLFFRLIIMPTNIKQQKSSAKQVRLQPKLRRIQQKYQDYAPAERNQKIQAETSELYQREGYSAMTAGCAPLLIQLPILWGLYGVVREPLKYVLQIPTELINTLSEVVSLSGTSRAYVETAMIANIDNYIYKIPETAARYATEIQKIRDFDFTVFGIDLGAIPDFSTFKALGSATTQAKVLLLIPILSFATSMLTSVLTQVRQKKNNPNMENAQMMGCMMLMMPLMSLWFTFQFPAGMGMYWILSNIFAFVQTLVLGHVYAPRKTIAKLMVDETIDRRSYEKNVKNSANNSAE